MSEKPIVREIALGECGSEFFQQQRINHSKTGFVLDLPGEVIRCQGNTVFAYPDAAAAVVVNDEGEGRRSAWMSSHVEDTNELIRMIHTLGAELDRTLMGDSRSAWVSIRPSAKSWIPSALRRNATAAVGLDRRYSIFRAT